MENINQQKIKLKTRVYYINIMYLHVLNAPVHLILDVFNTLHISAFNTKCQYSVCLIHLNVPLFEFIFY